MRFLVGLKAKGVPQGSLLDSARAAARGLGVQCSNPKWTSSGTLELDVFSPTRGDFDLFLEVVRPLADLEFARDLSAPPEHRSEPELLSEARSLFNAERYWECHEVLEGIWRSKQGEEKRLLQGIILVCAAFVHHQKGEAEVAIGIMRRARPQLIYPSPKYCGFDVGALRANVETVIQTGHFSNFRV
ncbi:MAG: DUF309 domain-containing protein [Nitrososphaerota archaeon]|nr:DUF309 domain-containing protein [Nitrososphaerota archaeon]MDG6968699.1 DUF309 domain-containing protein [Nitrososphaerota archaeon]MDG6975254.1 DUF309 domain-containing protein [Nitrososphaerota archaeon]